MIEVRKYDFVAICGLEKSIISHLELTGHLFIYILFHLLMAKTKPNVFLGIMNVCLPYKVVYLIKSKNDHKYTKIWCFHDFWLRVKHTGRERERERERERGREMEEEREGERNGRRREGESPIVAWVGRQQGNREREC